MAKRNYSNIAVETTLVSGITDSSSSLTVADPSGWPAAPFILIIDQGETKEELIPVGAKSGAVFSSLTRGFGGTSGVAHTAGATIKHVAVAEDLALIWAHVHTGVSGDDTAQVSHVSLGSVGSNDHHNQQHAIDGSDHTGTLDHDEIANQTVDDHHAQDHQARHIPGGADAIPTGVPGSSAPGDSAAEGSATSLSRSDHRHGREAASPTVAWSLALDADDDNFSSPLTVSWVASEVDIDTDTFWAVGNPTRITIPAGLGGIYLVTAAATFFNSEANETSFLRLLLNSTLVLETGQIVDPSSALALEKYVGFSRVLSLSAGDILEIQVADATTGGADLKGAATEKLTWFDGFRIGT